MTRRAFFRTLGLAVVTAPATATLVPEKLAAVSRWWVPVESWVKEFDCGRFLGICVSFRNVLSGAIVRSAVRMPLSRDVFGNVRKMSVVIERAKGRLFAWAHELPAWRLPVRPGHGHFDDVLEAREARLP